MSRRYLDKILKYNFMIEILKLMRSGVESLANETPKKLKKKPRNVD